jgi:hypothetical protein
MKHLPGFRFDVKAARSGAPGARLFAKAEEAGASDAMDRESFRDRWPRLPRSDGRGRATLRDRGGDTGAVATHPHHHRARSDAARNSTTESLCSLKRRRLETARA